MNDRKIMITSVVQIRRADEAASTESTLTTTRESLGSTRILS